MKKFTVSMIATTENGSVILSDDKGRMIRIQRVSDSYSSAHFFEPNQFTLDNLDKVHACKIYEIPTKISDDMKHLGICGSLAF